MLAAFAMLVVTAALVLVGLNDGRVGTGRMAADAILAIAVVVYAATGRLITSRLPSNAIGWLLGLIGLSVAASTLAEQYALYGLATAPGSLPAVRQIGALAGGFASITDPGGSTSSCSSPTGTCRHDAGARWAGYWS